MRQSFRSFLKVQEQDLWSFQILTFLISLATLGQQQATNRTFDKEMFGRFSRRLGPSKSVLSHNIQSFISKNIHRHNLRSFHGNLSLMAKTPFNLADIGEGISEVEVLQWYF